MEIRKQLKVCTSTFWSIESRQILDLYQNVDPRQILEPRQILDPRQNFINPRNPLGARNFLWTTRTTWPTNSRSPRNLADSIVSEAYFKKVDKGMLEGCYYFLNHVIMCINEKMCSDYFRF